MPVSLCLFLYQPVYQLVYFYLLSLSQSVRLSDTHYLDNRLKGGGKVVSLTRRPRFISQENYPINSWYSFLLEAESTPGPGLNPLPSGL
jgi:hypothetical protein